MGLSIIGNLWSKEYIIGINDAGLTRAMSLNIFQRIARRCFGCYQETYLENTLRNMTNTFTKSNFYFAEGEALKVKNLFSKLRVRNDNLACGLDSFDQSHILLEQKIINVKEQSFKYSLHYNPSSEYPNWALGVDFTDENNRKWSMQKYFDDIIEEDVLNISPKGITILSSGLDQEIDAGEQYLDDIMKEVLHHSLFYSSKLQGIRISAEEQPMHKMGVFKSSNLQNSAPLSLDFILELSKA